MPCDECDALRRQLREAREEIAEWSAKDGGNADRILALRLKLRVKPGVAKTIDALMEKPDGLVTTEHLIERCGAISEDRSAAEKGQSGIVNTNIYSARRALLDKIGGHGITTLYREGYTMTKEAARAVEALL